ncbi:Type I polyketide synthase component [Kitasatospora sp. MMS16-BH015]|uniref:acyl-CoA dehydrogenase family protein n=1 Tax=Kitasatospora sp. MMS16-BH015 TaxID=2018025 RepID=UPI000CA16FD8|nr:acyl-CoA dehydrogenase family protein [Kitasatospora sp. MMS16-BH015]AUG78890.1 Type I polyketide synthase component [Kitasatospora sp. MMS16-BH015]
MPSTGRAGPGSAGTDGEAEVRRRVAELERWFGDPADPANPLGTAAFLAADAREEPLAAAELLLERLGLTAEFVPRELGGRLTELDALARVVRVVFRRDAALGLGYGFTDFQAAVVIWAAGSPAQRQAAARLLHGGGRIVAAYPELASGSNFLANELTARPAEGAAVARLSGRKESFTNVSRADRLVLFARTGEGRHSHSVLLVDRAALPADRVADLPRRRTRGVRGCLVAGIEFADCPVPADALVGEPGGGLELTLRLFPVIRSVGPSVALGCADTALRTAVACVVDRGVVGRPSEPDGPQTLSHARSTLAGAFVDLLMCDCLALVATRAVHLAPADSGLYAAAVKYLLPQLLTDTSYELSTLLGAEFHDRDGAYGAFAKSVRDLPMIGLGAAGSAACRATVVPQLPRLARESWLRDAEPPAELFRLEAGGLPPLDFGRLSPAATGDPLAASLPGSAAATAADPGGHLAELSGLLAAELAGLREGCAALDRDGRSALLDPRGRALADRYALVLTGAACLGVWRHQQGPGAGFLADPGWLTVALTRLLRRLGTPTPKPPVDQEEPLLAEVLARFGGHRSYDLYDTPLAGGTSTDGEGRDSR